MEQILGLFATYHPARNLLFAILIVVLGHGLIKFVTHWLERAMTRAQVEPTVTRFVMHVSYVILLTVVAIIALGKLGIQTTSLLALLSAAGLALGLALHGSRAHCAAGLLHILLRPLRSRPFI